MLRLARPLREGLRRLTPMSKLSTASTSSPAQSPLTERIKGKSEIDVEKELFRTKRAMGAYYSKGYYTDALMCAVELEGAIDKLMGRDTAMYASALNNVALMNKMLGNLSAAADKYTQSLVIYDKAVGRKHPSYASTLNNLGILYRDQAAQSKGMDREQLLARADEALSDALALRTELLGAAHRDTLSTQNNVAALLRQMKREAEAEQRLLSTLALCRASFGDFDNLTAQTLNALGLLCKGQRRHMEAKAFYTEALRARSSTLGDAHPDTIVSMHNLAELLLEAGAGAEAEALQRQILEVVGKIKPVAGEAAGAAGEGQVKEEAPTQVKPTEQSAKKAAVAEAPPPFTYATRRKRGGGKP